MDTDKLDDLIMSQSKSRRKFTPEFRLEAAQLIVDQGATLRPTAVGGWFEGGALRKSTQ